MSSLLASISGPRQAKSHGLVQLNGIGRTDRKTLGPIRSSNLAGFCSLISASRFPA